MRGDLEPARSPGETGRLAYLTKRFPRLSETFILDEILGLERNGLPLQLYSLGHPGETKVQGDVAKVRSDVRYIHTPGSKLTRAKNTARIVASHLSVLRKHPRRYASVIAYVALKRRSRTAVKHLFEAGRFADLIERDGTGHIHAAFAHGPASVAHFASRLTGIPFSFSAHAKDLYLSAPDLLARKVAASSFVLVCSQSALGAVEDRVRAHHAPEVRQRGKNKPILAYHGVDIERFHPPLSERQEGPVRILAVGRLVPKKGYSTLIEALRIAKTSGGDFTCDIVGAGPLRAELESQAQDAGLQGIVRFVGALTQTEIAKRYTEVDVFVQASVVVSDGDRDGVPNSIMEAMATGLAVCGTDVAGIPEVIEDAKTGLLVQPADAVAMAQAIEALVSDEELRQRLGTAARAYTETHLARNRCNDDIAQVFRAYLNAGAVVPIIGRSQPEELIEEGVS